MLVKRVRSLMSLSKCYFINVHRSGTNVTIEMVRKAAAPVETVSKVRNM